MTELKQKRKLTSIPSIPYCSIAYDKLYTFANLLPTTTRAMSRYSRAKENKNGPDGNRSLWLRLDCWVEQYEAVEVSKKEMAKDV